MPCSSADIIPRYVRPPNPSAQHLRCFARLEGDLSEVLPYLNTRLQGHEFCPDPPSLTLKYRAKMITLTAHEIAINIVQDQSEAEEILEWLQAGNQRRLGAAGRDCPQFRGGRPTSHL